MNTKIRINSVVYNSKKSTPWESADIFMTGCYKACPECSTKELQSFDNGKRQDVTTVKWELLEKVPYKKVTFTGGEPFLQSEPLSYLAKELRNNDFLIVCYTGYTIEELPYLFPYAQDLLENVDILVDGPFLPQLMTGNPSKFEGSSNQRIINVQKTLNSGTIHLWTDEDTKKTYRK